MSSVAISNTTLLPAGSYRFRGALRSEWTKLWSVRSTAWTLVGTAAVTLAVGIIGMASTNSNWSHMGRAAQATFDPTSMSLQGVIFSQLVFGVLGVLVISSEYSTGTIRASFAAAPNRSMVLAAKVIVFTAVALVVGELLSFSTFLIGQSVMTGAAPHASLGDPGVLRAVVGGGLFLAILGLFAMGIASILRHTAAAITSYVGFLLVVPLVIGGMPASIKDAVMKFTPAKMADTMTAVIHVPGDTPAFGPWNGFGLLCVYCAVALAVGSWLVVHRDA